MLKPIIFNYSKAALNHTQFFIHAYCIWRKLRLKFDQIREILKNDVSIWSSFLVETWNYIISCGWFHFFWNFSFPLVIQIWRDHFWIIREVLRVFLAVAKIIWLNWIENNDFWILMPFLVVIKGLFVSGKTMGRLFMITWDYLFSKINIEI